MSGRQSVQKGCRRVPLMHQELCRTENRRGSLVGAPSLVRTHALKFLWPFQCVRKQRCVPQFFPPQFFPSAERPALVRLRAGSTRSDGRLKVWSAVRARAGSGSERASEARSNEIEGLPPRLVPPDVVSALEQKERPTSSGRVGSRQRKIESLALPAPPCPRRFSVGPAYWRHFSSTRQLGSSSQPFAEANVCADTG